MSSDLPTLTQLGKGSSKFVRFEDGKLYYEAEWWEDAHPLPIRHTFEFPIDVADAGGGAFLPYDKTLRFLRWAGKELQRLKHASTMSTNQCMGCQAGWGRMRSAYSASAYYHAVEGGYVGEIIACTRDRDGA